MSGGMSSLQGQKNDSKMFESNFIPAHIKTYSTFNYYCQVSDPGT